MHEERDTDASANDPLWDELSELRRRSLRQAETLGRLRGELKLARERAEANATGASRLSARRVLTTAPSPSPAGGRPDWIPRIPPPDRPPERPGLKVGAILDPFSVATFRYEVELIQFGQDDWRTVLDRERPAFLFVESAWRGNEGRWNYTLARREGPREAVGELVAWCRSEGIPTVFWNKEDPNNFDLFVQAALLFDHVFTVDAACVGRYRDEFGHTSVGVLPFAAQPRIHNPINVPGGRTHNVAFAGSWFGDKHPHRKAQMESILKPARQFGLHIFSRLETQERYRFPAPLNRHVVGSLDYDDMPAANKSYKVMLNVNSVANSETMCARRIFELLACGTAVLSGPAPAIDRIVGPGIVNVSNDAQETAALLRMLLRNDELRDRAAVRGLRRILREHTYSHRIDEIMRTLGHDPDPRAPSVSVVCATNRAGNVDVVIANVARQAWRPLELVMVLHGLDLDHDDVRARALAAGIDSVTVVGADGSLTLGACLNLGCEHADGDVLSKMDDDNFYGPEYIGDLVNAFLYTDAGVVGKWAHYVHLSARRAMILRFPDHEHRYTPLVQGGTLTCKRDVWERVRFPDLPRGVDTHFLRSCQATGVRVYSTDRFNFVSVRAATTEGHTWKASDDELMTMGLFVYQGSEFDHVVV